MIRFIDLRGQIYFDDDYKNSPCFAFFDTIVDRFMTFGDTQTWYGWEEFRKSYNFYAHMRDLGIKRYKHLIPKDYFKEKP